MNSRFRDEGIFLNQLGNPPALTHEEEIDLSITIQDKSLSQGERWSAAWKLVLSNVGLVPAIAMTFLNRNSYLTLSDLVSAGVLGCLSDNGNLNGGLLGAAWGFDHSKGYRFSTYACHFAKRAVEQACRDSTKGMRVSRYTLEQARFHEGASESTRIERARSVLYGRLPLSDVDPAVEPSSKHEEEDEARQAGVKHLNEALGNLQSVKPRHYDVVCRSYGLRGQTPMPSAVLGAELGVAPSSVRRMKMEAEELIKAMYSRYVSPAEANAILYRRRNSTRNLTKDAV